MTVTVEKLPKNEAKLAIEATPEEVRPHLERAAQKISEGFKVQGFRPGRAPLQMVVSTVGKEAFLAEALEETLPSIYTAAIQQEGLAPITRPEINLISFDLDEPLRFEATVPLVPEVGLGDLSKLKLKSEPIEVPEAEITETLDELRKTRGSAVAVDRPAKEGDRIEVDFEGFNKGVPFEGGKSQNHPVVLGEGVFIPGFEEALIGVKVGEEREFPITFPADYHAKLLAGQTVTFKTRTNLVHEVTLPELNDEFAQGFGAKSSAELKEQVTDSLRARRQDAEQERLRGEALGALVKAAKIDLSDRLIAAEAENLLSDMGHRLEHEGGSLDQYLESVRKTREQFQDELKPEAERRIRAGLALGEYAKGLDIKVSDADVEREYSEAHHGHTHEGEEVEQLKDEVRQQLLTRAALDQLVEQAGK